VQRKFLRAIQPIAKIVNSWHDVDLLGENHDNGRDAGLPLSGVPLPDVIYVYRYGEAPRAG